MQKNYLLNWTNNVLNPRIDIYIGNSLQWKATPLLNRVASGV